MREDICSIPISEVFEPKEGCPICRMRAQLEERIVEYITGAAMMEPDVREETNKTGFCYEHLVQMSRRKKRLSVALTLQSHLSLVTDTIEQLYQTETVKKPAMELLHTAEKGCFVCDKIEYGVNHLLTTLFKLWQEEEDFRKLYTQQEYLCYPHYLRLITDAQGRVHRKKYGAFVKESSALAKKYTELLSADLKQFCDMHDYRNAGKDWGNSKNAIERAIYFLSGRAADGAED